MCYGVLRDVSIDYPPHTGTLLTRYSPFRRSPPEYCYPALPLDLHVLSLPLAFILSQDQTLLCIFFLFSWPSSIVLKLTLSIYFVRYLLLVLSFSLFNDLFSALRLGWAVKNPAHFLKRDCKGTHFF